MRPESPSPSPCHPVTLPPCQSPRPIRKVVLPAAGLGTRLRPLTHFMPKEMLPVGGKVVLQYVLEECAEAGLDQLLAVLSPTKLDLLRVLDPPISDFGFRISDLERSTHHDLSVSHVPKSELRNPKSEIAYRWVHTI